MSACCGQILNRLRTEHRCKAAGNQEEEADLDLSHGLQKKTGHLHANNLRNKESPEKRAWQTMDWNTDNLPN